MRTSKPVAIKTEAEAEVKKDEKLKNEILVLKETCKVQKKAIDELKKALKNVTLTVDKAEAKALIAKKTSLRITATMHRTVEAMQKKIDDLKVKYEHDVHGKDKKSAK